MKHGKERTIPFLERDFDFIARAWIETNGVKFKCKTFYTKYGEVIGECRELIKDDKVIYTEQHPGIKKERK